MTDILLMSLPATSRPSHCLSRRCVPGVVVLLVCAVGAVLPGCTAKSDSVGQLSADQAAELNASRSTFDSDSPPPIRPQTHLAAGRLAESRGDLEQAATQYRRALRQNPDDREALFRLGTLLSKQTSADAPGVWRQYVKATGGSATAWANLGFSHELLGQTLDAEEAYRNGIAADGANEACRVNYGLLLARQGRTDAAEQQLAAVLPPEQVWYNIGAVSERKGETATAVAAYRKALTHQPEFAAARQRLDALLPSVD